MVIQKVTNYLKEKTAELDSMRAEKEKLQHVIEEKNIGNLFFSNLNFNIIIHLIK